ncbi:hypothetical protein [Plantibacter sp. LMC-P-059a]|uniref:hypothetical protein n=1 Tax=Plantibacter sp. LMC-P-059a TaxID=3040297 RepID=UPI00254EF188|nr:hypothetical protein [Plantibacter sp. LMC-P-059a]
MTVDPDGTIRNWTGVPLYTDINLFEWSRAPGGADYQDRLLLSEFSPIDAPSASIGTPTLAQGGSAQVTATFNAAAGGQRIDIDHPAGTKITAVGNSAFTLNSRGMTGTLPSGTTSVTFTLTADQNAPIGTALGGQVAYGANRTKLADFTAEIEAPAVAPAVSIESVTVQQGDSVDVDVEFNEAVSGQVDIILPAGLTPTGRAPSGFTWTPSIKGFRGTVTDANRAFTMDLTAATDAAVGTFTGVVRGSGLEQAWSATITAAQVAPDVTIESVTVQQGQSVDVDVEFNGAVSGEVEIVVPKGLSPVGKAPAGFTWEAPANEYVGTVTNANRAFTMHLAAAADAPVGTFRGSVYADGLAKRWNVTITAAPVAPDVTVETVDVQQGESVDVDVEFNGSVSGAVEIIAPAGLTPVGKAPAGFTWLPSINGYSGTVSNANRAFTMHLQAAADAPVGSFHGVVRGSGLDEWWYATITAAPVAPAVTIDSVTVRQGETVDAPVEFNKSVSGQVEIVVPNGLSPVGKAPTGFTWLPSMNGFSGTVTDANRAFTLHLQAASDAPIGTFDGVVRGGGLNQTWSATITAGVPIPDEPVVLTSPAIGAVLEPGAPVFSGTGQAGATIQVYSAAQALLGETEVLSDGSWSLTWNTSLTPGRYSGGTVRQYVGAKPYTSVTYDFTVKATEVAPLVVTSPKVGETIEETTPVFTGTAQPGARVEIRGGWGDVLGSVDSVASNGQWSITWNKSVMPGRYSGGTVKQFVGDVERGKFVYDFTVESAEVAPLVVTAPKVGATIEERTPVFTGTAQPGAKVEIRGASGSLLGSVDSVASNGQWSITWNKTVVPGRYSGGTVKQFVNGVERGKFVYDFTIGSANVAPLLVTSPKVGETTHETTPVFTGSAQPGAKVEIRGASGAILGSVESVASNGRWSITWNKTVLPARYSGGTVKQFVNGVERGKFIYDFTIVASQLVVSSPRVGETISGTRPVFTGTAIPNAEIQIRGAWGTDLGHTTANEHGEWTITWPSDYKPARYSGGTVTESVNGKVIGTFTYDFILEK